MENISTFALSFIIVMLLTIAFIFLSNLKGKSNQRKAIRKNDQQKIENNKTSELFKNNPTSMAAQKIGDLTLKSSQELKRILMRHNCIDCTKVNIESLEYVLFMYDLECYKQVMTLKYSGNFIEIVIKTIFSTMEDNNTRAGNYVPQGFLWSHYVSLSNDLNDIFSRAVENDVDGFLLIAMFLCRNECQMPRGQVKDEEALLGEVAEHFNKIVNIPLEMI